VVNITFPFTSNTFTSAIPSKFNGYDIKVDEVQGIVFKHRIVLFSAVHSAYCCLPKAILAIERIRCEESDVEVNEFD
jgi:hypothetical protein